MKKGLLILICFLLIFATSCEKPEFSCKKCEYFDFNEYQCKEAACCSDSDCADNEKCLNPRIKSAVCIGENDCSEKLKHQQCSEKKPEYCSYGKIIELCTFCGCELGHNCINQSCIKIKYPIILVHGFTSSGKSWNVFREFLEKDNFTVYSPDFVPPDGDINLLSAQLDQEINNILDETNSSYLDVIAHSMGGIIVRNYLNKIDYAPITKIVFIGTPHKGSSMSWYLGVESVAAQQLRYESDFMNEVNSPPLRENISYLNIIGNRFEKYSVQHDGLILAREAYLENQTNYYFKLDHFELQKSEAVYDDVKKFLVS